MARVRLRNVQRELPRHAHDLAPKVVAESQRWRIIEAMVEEVARNGIADSNVAGVIERAGVSRKTFYEHFADFEACFLATYDVLAKNMIERIASLKGDHASQIHKFLEDLETDRRIAMTFMVGVLGAGPKALAAREKVNRAFADAFYASIKDPVHRAAIVGGINAVIISELLAPKHESLIHLGNSLVSWVGTVSKSSK
ncbi:MAG: TetR/AcrR family transcriptional regulator [Kofleriaceae bacterium]